MAAQEDNKMKRNYVQMNGNFFPASWNGKSGAP